MVFFKNLFYSFFYLVSDTELSNIPTGNTTNENYGNISETDDIRRSSRTTTQKNYARQQEGDSNDDDDDEDLYVDGRPPPRRMRYKKRRDSDESFIDDDDDYEKLQRKRKIVKYGKSMSRSSITDHLKKLVDEDEQSTEGKRSGMICYLLAMSILFFFFYLYSITITRWNARKY